MSSFLIALGIGLSWALIVYLICKWFGVTDDGIDDKDDKKHK